MYLPAHFRIDDRRSLLQFAAAHSFATVITGDEVSHLPLLVDEARGVLRGHLARANPQFKLLESGVPALCIFHGPHAYISPSIYAEHPSVPTWNYAVVHARGRARMLDPQELASLLDDLVAHFDQAGWRFDPPSDYRRKMMGAIAGFEISVESLQGKFKLSQNRPPEDRRRVTEWLSGGDPQAQAVAALMRALGV